MPRSIYVHTYIVKIGKKKRNREREKKRKKERKKITRKEKL